MRCVLINSIVVKVVVKERLLLLLLLLLFDLLYAPLATTSKGKVTPKNTFSSSFL